ncbi:undecaprenyldiphospho-muramoylpentapeptide beta-N-acetylglucosaminyltransferase [Larsenimonas rhizosphaerae]|uniref:undecaprenyldiphospho-muramoylpentapeptide beta-N-acetylglucosaminyltransferase n=1 Tax=Larsenimonas rhizosphaerae TaxID=2944682 RepID=UPI002033D154|nr:undecaprenyldiphospho-muramoylpentapeptide beta-N-acetylglucosaminyltransferase [Larsenimonas rhizosphaerae]MCM2131044.1 undecaprenyldiphospho-muramoylpentapeptide beta-N-acetylglucosaminyltransferase [Larsenimonas rhizosphaerae]
MSTPRRALIMAGGTGGHVIPALSLARALTELGVEVHWLGTPRGIENTLVPEAGYPLHHVRVAGLRGNGAAGWLKAPFKLVAALHQARQVIRTVSPGIVIGLGGFASGPGGVAARLGGCPLVIHEQNAVAGMTNTLLSYLATRTYAAFPGAFKDRRGAIVVGNPVRNDIAMLGEPPREVADMTDRPLHLAITGGSLGAQSLNDTVPAALARLPDAKRPLVRHQAGRGKGDAARAAYEQAGIQAEVSEFVTDMAALYQWADVMICRSGALTVSELAAAGKPSVLVPYPFAVDDHQAVNARFLVDHGAAVMIRQSSLNDEGLATTLETLLSADVLADMAHKARAQAKLEAMTIMARDCMEIGFDQ